jgi:hypothetical protein
MRRFKTSFSRVPLEVIREKHAFFRSGVLGAGGF